MTLHVQPLGGARAGRLSGHGFSLLEVMIAVGIFFMVSFSILAVVSSGLRTARALQVTRPNAGMLAAQLSLTNRLEEGTESGDFGNLYRDYTWTRDTYEAGTNGLWEVDFQVFRRGNRGAPDSRMSLLIYSPNSQTKRLGVQQ
jgi:type II secretory pathway pseudopilin PulG